MNSPHCYSGSTRQRHAKTSLGYKQYHCRECGKQYK